MHVTEFTCTYIVYEYLYTNELIRWRSGQPVALYTVMLPSLSVCSWIYAHLSMGVCVHVCVPLCILAMIPHTKHWECGCIRVCVCAPMCMHVYACICGYRRLGKFLCCNSYAVETNCENLTRVLWEGKEGEGC